MNATDIQLALISERVYEAGGGPRVSDDWELVLDANRANLGDLKGYFSAAWYSGDTKELVFAHRGTEADCWQDWMTDAQTIFGVGNPQIPVAQRFYDAAIDVARANNYQLVQITHTGHSLGGNTSQILAALRTTERAVTFNPLACAPLLQVYQLDPNGTYANIRSVSSWFDPAAAASGSIGQMFHMPVSTYPIIPDVVESVASVLFGAIAFKFVGPAGLVALQLHFRTSQHSIVNLREVIEAAGRIVDTPLPAPQNQWQDLQGALESNPALQLAATAPEYVLQPHLTRDEIRFELGAESETARVDAGTDAADFMAGADGADALAGAEGADLLYGGLGQDALDGGASDDVLVGGAGSDILRGGTGTDWLVGGIGLDTYVYRMGDGRDSIVDEDKRGRIVIETEAGTGDVERRVAGTLIKASSGNTWTSPDGTLTLTHDSSWKIVLPDGGEIDLGDTLNAGDFGLQVKDFVLANPTTPPIAGDLTPVDGDPGTPGVQYSFDSLGNVIVDPGEATPDRADVLYNSGVGDVIEAKGGNDWIEAWRGGDDRLDAGAGRDMVLAGSGHDLVIGGADKDRLVGEAGDDVLYGGEEIAVTAAYGIGAVQAGTGERGDWIDGRSGEDIAIGDAGEDALFGGDAGDVLFGGGGADNLFGDRESLAIPFIPHVERSRAQPACTGFS